MISITGEGNLNVEINKNKYLLKYPCANDDCFPYKIEFTHGKYLLECWGASGSSTTSEFVRGAYASGILSVAHQFTLYAYLGNVGSLNGRETFNGGGKGSEQGNSGGGATDFRLVNGSYSSLESLISRIIVAGGGAGLNQYSDKNPYYDEKHDYGHGGSVEGGEGYVLRISDPPQINLAKGGSQNEGGLSGFCSNSPNGCTFGCTDKNNRAKLGIGANAQHYKYSSAGGGGYFGGGAGAVTADVVGSGAGGSSYVSGHPLCSSIVPDNSNNLGYYVRHETSVHHSHIELLEPIMIGGNETIIEPNGSSVRGHTGPGYARITILNPCNFFSHKIIPSFSYICFVYIILITLLK